MSEQGKWERMARELAATIREQRELTERLELLQRQREQQERVLQAELGKEKEEYEVTCALAGCTLHVRRR